MNREQRRKIEKKANKIWKLEMLACFCDDKTIKENAQKDIEKIAKTCTEQELYLIDEYITEYCAPHS